MWKIESWSFFNVGHCYAREFYWGVEFGCRDLEIRAIGTFAWVGVEEFGYLELWLGN